MEEKIEALKVEVDNANPQTPAEVEEFRIKYLSKKGVLSSLMDEFRNIPADQKREMGQKLNELKSYITETYNQLKERASNSGGLDVSTIDLTRSATSFPVGSRHPISIVRNDILKIFADMGFSVAEGPEIEDDWHVFSSLNFPPDHPARDMQDTFFITRDGVNV